MLNAAAAAATTTTTTTAAAADDAAADAAAAAAAEGAPRCLAPGIRIRKGAASLSSRISSSSASDSTISSSLGPY